MKRSHIITAVIVLKVLAGILFMLDNYVGLGWFLWGWALANTLYYPPITTHWTTRYECVQCKARSQWSSRVSWPCVKCGHKTLWGPREAIVRYHYRNWLLWFLNRGTVEVKGSR